jgi:hypothetical protein
MSSLGCDAVWLSKNKRFGGTYSLHHQIDKSLRASIASYC